MHQDRHEGSAYRRIEVITGVARRRRWTDAEKAALVAESLQPDVNVSALARRFGVNRGLLQTWRRNAARQVAAHGAVFVPLHVEAAPTADGTGIEGRPAPAGEPSAVPAVERSTIEIEAGAVRIRFCGPVNAAALRLVLAHLGRPA